MHLCGALRKHLDASVMWSDSVLAMRDSVSENFIEFGPGKVLAGLCKRIDRGLSASAADGPAGIERALAMVQS